MQEILNFDPIVTANFSHKSVLNEVQRLYLVPAEPKFWAESISGLKKYIPWANFEILIIL